MVRSAPSSLTRADSLQSRFERPRSRGYGFRRRLVPNEVLLAFKAASTHTSVRLTRPLVADRGSNLLQPPSWSLPLRLEKVVAA
jgi:hypothetical protein